MRQNYILDRIDAWFDDLTESMTFGRSAQPKAAGSDSSGTENVYRMETRKIGIQ